MDAKEAFKRLAKIKEKLSEEEFPETIEIIKYYLEEYDDDIPFYTQKEIAETIGEADLPSVFPNCVKKFLVNYYEKKN